MGDYIIMTIVGAIVLCAAFSVLKKAKSKSSCCGSGTYVAKSRRLKTVVQKKTFCVEGMECQNCVNRVMEDVQGISGTSVSVNLKKGLVTVSMEKAVEDAVIIAAIEKHGYKVIG